MWVSYDVIKNHLAEAFVANVDKDLLVPSTVLMYNDQKNTLSFNEYRNSVFNLSLEDITFTKDVKIKPEIFQNNEVEYKIITKGSDNLDYLDIVKADKGNITVNVNGENLSVQLLELSPFEKQQNYKVAIKKL